MINLAIFGGSFNPPHSGHKAIIESALRCEWIDFLVILPNFQNPLKSEASLNAKSKVKALESMLENIADSTNFIFYKNPPTLQNLTQNLHKNKKSILLSSFEISQEKLSFSIDSILYFKNLYKPKNLYFIIGADILPQLDKWHKIQQIKKLVTFIVATRDNLPIPSGFLRFEIDEKISSTQIRANDKFNDFLAESNAKSHHKGRILSSIDNDMQKRLDSIIALLDSKKAEDIMLFDLQNRNYITQFVIIATSLADKHSFALLDTLKTELKAQGEVFYSTDEESGDWIIADLGEIMIHIFTENHRKKFNLEEFLAQKQKQDSSK